MKKIIQIHWESWLELSTFSRKSFIVNMNASNSINSTKTFHDAILIPYFLTVDIEKYVRAYIFPVVFGIGSLWNSLIIIYFVKIDFKNLKKMSSYHFLIINLAIVDLCTRVGVTVKYLFLQNPTWQDFVYFFLENFVNWVLPMVSCWLLVIISFARFRSIVYPLRAKFSKKKHDFACFSIWLLASLMIIYVFMNRKFVKFSRLFGMCFYWPA